MTNYKTIVTFRNGTHKILRMTRDLVAKFVYIFREMQKTRSVTCISGLCMTTRR